METVDGSTNKTVDDLKREIRNLLKKGYVDKTRWITNLFDVSAVTCVPIYNFVNSITGNGIVALLAIIMIYFVLPPVIPKVCKNISYLIALKNGNFEDMVVKEAKKYADYYRRRNSRNNADDKADDKADEGVDTIISQLFDNIQQEREKTSEGKGTSEVPESTKITSIRPVERVYGTSNLARSKVLKRILKPKDDKMN